MHECVHQVDAEDPLDLRIEYSEPVTAFFLQFRGNVVHIEIVGNPPVNEHNVADR